MHPVLILFDYPPKHAHNIVQFSHGKKTFIKRLLPTGAVTLEQLPHPVKPPLIRYVIGNEIKGPVHEIKLYDKKRGVSAKTMLWKCFCSIDRGSLPLETQNHIDFFGRRAALIPSPNPSGLQAAIPIPSL